MALSARACAALALALVVAIPATGDGSGAGNTAPVDFPWAEGKSWTDPAPRPGPWTPWPTDDPVIWAADACLGFYLTRDRAVFSPAILEEIAHKDLYRRLYAKRDDPPVRVTVFNWPAPHLGVFQCQTMTWPALAKPDPAAFTSWVEACLSQAEGWQPATDPRSSIATSTGIARWHTELGATLRVYWLFDAMTVEIEADYHGPPVVIVEGPY